MEISITGPLEDLVKTKMKTGDYKDETELLSEALQQMEDRDNYAAFKREALLGHEQALRGEFSDRTPQEIAAGVRKRNGL